MNEKEIPVHLQTTARDIDEFVEAHRMRLFNLCRDLVAARSVNPPGHTHEAAVVIEAFLNEHELDCERLYNVAEKPNIVCQTKGNKTGSHLILNGHLDTVSPGREEDWSVPLYQTVAVGRKITGLGMGNMKAGVAALTLAYVWLANNADNWPGTISYTAVADETVFGPDGAGWLLNQRPDLKGDAVVCGEGPGNMDLAIAEKGLLWVEVTATAPSGQGMLAQPCSSAISRLANAITQIDAWNELRVEPPPELAQVKPHAGAHGLRLSVNAGMISGGHFVSQIATDAKAEIDFRVPPGMTTSDIEQRLKQLCRQTDGLAYRRIKGWEPNWTPADQAISKAVAASSSVVTGKDCNPVIRLPASDASRWRAVGTPAICFGPQPLLASGIDDFAYAQDILDCAKIYALSAIQYLCRSAATNPD